MTSLEILKQRGFLWDQIILEWKIRSLGPGLTREQNVVKGGGVKPKVNVIKYVLNFLWRRYKETIVPQTYHRWGLGAGSPAAEAFGRFFRNFWKNSYLNAINHVWHVL